MKPKKEHYRQKLPHFQQAGQWYSVTVSLHGAMPKNVMAKYSFQLAIAKNQYQQLLKHQSSSSKDSDFSISMISETEKIKTVDLKNSRVDLTNAKKGYYMALRKYRLAYDKFLHKSTEPTISLIKPVNLKIIEEALQFWEGKRLKSYAWCIMSNHFHWILTVFEKNENNEAVYLQDILHSVKQFTAKKINNAENIKGQFWAHESFETTIRNNQHFTNVFNYVLNNPVSAGLVTNWKEWPGTWTEDMDFINQESFGQQKRKKL